MANKKEGVAPIKKIKKPAKPLKPALKKESAVIPETVIQKEYPRNESDSADMVQDDEIMQENQSKKWWIIFGLIFFVAACSALLYYIFSQGIPAAWDNPYTQKETPVTNSWVLENMAPISKDTKVSNWNTIKVDYVGKLEDGTIFDSSIEEFAKKTKSYKADSGRKFEPLEFTVWEWQMIKWFDAWVVWMKAGEKKTLTIAPKDAYGESYNSQSVETKYLQDSFDQEVPAESFKDVISREFPKEMLGEKANNLKVGEEIENGWVSWKVTAITGSWVTIEIKNTQNPFFGKEIKVWEKANYQWNDIVIKAIGDNMVTVNIQNKQNPFYGKKLIDWLTGKLPNWQEIRIVKVWEKNTDLEIKNDHELAWKTLIFDIELKEIVK
ncbi:MAG: hypothetical protein ACD_3C00178G0002 [uncultured bacterium (gcode 4)]|uniref:peptidylprolyl isomerase n=1 Tax=uncultured bacterium (gcode 4) TaxID=1234023 RepID=K2F9B3_9BACT|nr:MAG: hypothetical protein ACD_3C00178G0002 [uncultured bacterium (gcode 4)]